MASAYDFASFCVLIPLTYFGGRATASKPRWIGFGVLLMAIGSLVFALPHFLADTYRASSGQLDVCQADEIATVAGKSVRNKVKRNAPLAINSNSITFHYFPARGTKGKGRGLFVDRLPLYSRAITARSGCGTSLHAGRHIHRRECVQENVFDLLG